MKSLLLGLAGSVALSIAVPTLAQQHDHLRRAAATTSAAEHVPPDPPTTPLHDMSPADMVRMMQMDDSATHFSAKFQELERRFGSPDAFGWEGEAWWGGDRDKLWLKTEGERADGDHTATRTEALWDRATSRWWRTQAGLRHDAVGDRTREWLAVGIEGIAPFGIETEATVYLGEGGRTAARLGVRQDVLLTQRLILQPAIEAEAYGRRDPALDRASGIGAVEGALRLRYELRREFAPYLGLSWTLHRGSAGTQRDWQALAGLRFWF